MESTFNINNPSPGSQPGVRITLRRNSIQRKKEHKCLLDGASSGFPSSQLLCDFHLGMTRKVHSEQIIRSSTLARFASRRVSSQVCPPTSPGSSVSAEQQLKGTGTRIAPSLLTKAACSWFTSVSLCSLHRGLGRRELPSFVLPRQSWKTLFCSNPSSLGGLWGYRIRHSH